MKHDNILKGVIYKLKILMIDDNQDDIFLAEEAMKVLNTKKGVQFSITGCISLEEAKHYQDNIQLIFLDLNLRFTSGLETLDLALEIFKDLPIIVMTGMNNDDLGLECIRKGAVDYINKWDINNFNLIHKAINYAIERYQLQKNLTFKNELLNKQINIIEEKQERLNAIIESSLGGIVTIDSDNKITGTNTVAIELFKYENTRLLDKDLTSFIEFPSKIDAKNFSWSDFNEIPLTYIITANLERHPVKLSSKILEGETNEIIINIKDLSAEIIAEETKIALDKQKELNQLKTNFISIASHEFRTPLSTIASSASLIKLYENKDNISEKRLRHLDRIQSNVKHLVSILEDFLSITKLEEGIINISLEEFDFEMFSKDLTEEMSLISKKGQVIIQDHKGNKNVRSDKKLLTTILYNLLSNSIKYCSENATIYFNSELNESYFEIEIIDKGIGIPKKQLNQLFTRFFRANNVGNIEGTGLGLHIVKKYVDLLDGSISVESDIGKGTTFSLKFKTTHE